MSTDRIPMSKEGYEKMKAQLDRMKTRTCPGSPSKLPRPGDLVTSPKTPNSTRPSRPRACFRPGSTTSKISSVRHTSSRSPTSPPTGSCYGSKVRVLDLELNEEEDFILVGPGEEDYDQNKILLTSPIGQGLVGKMVGAQVEVQIPRGVLKLKIVEIGVS